jgi:hypothetical protein
MHPLAMSTLAEIEAAVEMLPARQKQELLVFLANDLRGAKAPRPRKQLGLKAAGRPALDGLPADLSTATKERVRAMIAQRDATRSCVKVQRPTPFAQMQKRLFSPRTKIAPSLMAGEA